MMLLALFLAWLLQRIGGAVKALLMRGEVGTSRLSRHRCFLARREQQSNREALRFSLLLPPST